MIIKEIIRITAELLDLKRIRELPVMGGTNESAHGKEEMLILMRSFNLVYKEIAAEYIPLIKIETIECDGKLNYDILSEQVAEILAVTDTYGVKRAFYTYPAFAETAAGKLKVKYSYIPQECDINGETDYKSKIDERIFAYGSAAEFCLITGAYDDAAVWNNKYINALTAVAGKKSEMKIAARRWL